MVNNFIDPERQAFEEWFASKSESAADFLKLDEDGINYFHDYTVFAWSAWQASAKNKNKIFVKSLQKLWSVFKTIGSDRTKKYPSFVWDTFGDRQEELLVNNAKRQEIQDLLNEFESEAEKTVVQFIEK